MSTKRIKKPKARAYGGTLGGKVEVVRDSVRGCDVLTFTLIGAEGSRARMQFAATPGGIPQLLIVDLAMKEIVAGKV